MTLKEKFSMLDSKTQVISFNKTTNANLNLNLAGITAVDDGFGRLTFTFPKTSLPNFQSILKANWNGITQIKFYGYSTKTHFAITCFIYERELLENDNFRLRAYNTSADFIFNNMSKDNNIDFNFETENTKIILNNYDSLIWDPNGTGEKGQVYIHLSFIEQ